MRTTILTAFIIVSMLFITASVLWFESEGTGIVLCMLIMSAYGLIDIKPKDNE